MTEIKIEKKSAVWPWILVGLILLAVILYSLFFRNSNQTDNAAVTDTNNTANTALIDAHENNSTVTDYISFVKGDTAKMALDHAYSSEALTKLIQATRAMAGETGFDIKADLDSAESCAQQITVNPTATNHADLIKKAAMTLGGSLQRLQAEKYPSLSSEASEVVSSASAINPAELTLDQKASVQTFFDNAAMLLQKMN